MKKFNLLVLGGAHPFSPHVTAKQSFVEQLSRRLAQEGLSLMVECWAPLSLAAMASVLPRLPLRQYDLIVLQPGHYELQRPESLSTLFKTTYQPATFEFTRPQFSLLTQLRDAIALAGLRLLTGLRALPVLRQTRHDLRVVLESLQPYGHNVMLVTPFPHQDIVSGWLRRQGQRVFLEEGYRACISVFDAYSLLDVGDVCFLPDDQAQLNALGHELVGSELYDFFRAGARVVGDSSNYR